MKRIFFIIGSLCMLFTNQSAAKAKKPSNQNILLTPWQGPYGGLPPFDKVQVSELPKALEAAMAEGLLEIAAIANNPESPTFENTFIPLQESGDTLSRVKTIYEVWSGSLSTPELRKIETQMNPKLSAYTDKISQNSKLFKRIESVYQSKDFKKLDAESQRLVRVTYTQFVLGGAKLNPTQKTKVSKINQELSKLTTQFAQNQLADEENDYLVVKDIKELKGLPQSIINDALSEAKRLKLKGKWVIANTRSFMDPVLTDSPNRDLREKAFYKWTHRGDNKNSSNNNKIVTKILNLRTQKAKLMGFPSYAHMSLSDTMAQKPEAAMDLMLKVWKPAIAQVHKDVQEMQALADAEAAQLKIKAFKIAPWDYRYFAEKLRQSKYDIDFNLVKPYLSLENIRNAMFWVAGKVFELYFEEVKDVPVFHPTMSVYKVLDKNKNFVGLWYFDPFARPGKQSGAWMSAYREQSRMGGKDIKTLVSNNSNFVPSTNGETLLSWDDAVTMFHEFGHAIHGLSSNVTYESLSGTETYRDFVEFPSQVYENWLLTPEVMKFLKDKNGKVIPQELVKKIQNARTFNSGFDKVEYLASAIVDMKLHMSTAKDIDPKKFEAATLKEIGMPSEIVMRHRIPHFGHIFSGGYSAGYYSYLWAQVLEKDAFEAFTETKDYYNPKIAKKLREYIFSIGNTMDPAEAYRLFRGRDPSVDALLRANGFM
ncbi:MAG: M3 family metallopeptidase [Bdellovibrionota bacterium]